MAKCPICEKENPEATHYLFGECADYATAEEQLAKAKEIKDEEWEEIMVQVMAALRGEER